MKKTQTQIFLQLIEATQSLIAQLNVLLNQLKQHLQAMLDAPQPIDAEQHAICPYVCVEVLQEKGISIAVYERRLCNESQGSAAQFCKFLHAEQKKGFLHFKHHTKKQIFETLHACLPEMRWYSLNTFRDEF